MVGFVEAQDDRVSEPRYFIKGVPKMSFRISLDFLLSANVPFLLRNQMQAAGEGHEQTIKRNSKTHFLGHPL